MYFYINAEGSRNDLLHEEGLFSNRSFFKKSRDKSSKIGVDVFDYRFSKHTASIRENIFADSGAR